ncbi:MAG TPA: ATPase domain-containing protein, partial [Terriglobales bacterium]|nr:ATPase domain-containing protein [Terriglobales bacterium]
MSRTVAISEVQDACLKTGIRGLDHILSGGLPQGHIYLLEGDPGAGKTTAGLQFLLAGKQNRESVMYVTLSESKAELLRIARSHGFDISGVQLMELTSAEVLNPDGHYTVFHPSEIELAGTTKRILDEVRRIDPSRLVIDSLSELRVLARDALRYRRQIMALKKFFEGRKTTVLLLDDRTGENRDEQLYSIAHGVISLEKMRREYGATRRRMEVVKLRGVRYREGFHDYHIQTGGVVIFPRLVASEHMPGFEPGVACSGVEELDALLGGGLDRGTSTLLIGPAGCGKSTLALRFAATACSRSEHVSIYTFEEGRNTVFARAKGLGMDLEAYLNSGMLTLEQVNP